MILVAVLRELHAAEVTRLALVTSPDEAGAAKTGGGEDKR